MRFVHTCMNKKCEQQIDDNQFGFRNEAGILEPLFSLNTESPRYERRNIDRVHHQKLTEILRAKGIHESDLQMITEHYWQQMAQVKVDNNISQDP